MFSYIAVNIHGVGVFSLNYIRMVSVCLTRKPLILQYKIKWSYSHPIVPVRIVSQYVQTNLNLCMRQNMFLQ